MTIDLFPFRLLDEFSQGDRIPARSSGKHCSLDGFLYFTLGILKPADPVSLLAYLIPAPTQSLIVSQRWRTSSFFPSASLFRSLRIPQPADPSLMVFKLECKMLGARTRNSSPHVPHVWLGRELPRGEISPASSPS